MQLLTVIYLAISLFLVSCAKDKSTVEIIEEKEIELQMIDSYQEGLDALEFGDGFLAAKKFSEAELLFPQSAWAPKSALMAAYSYYFEEYYTDTIYETERFLKTYPNHPRTDYAYYLLGIAYYDQIVDEARDLRAMMKSKEYFEYIINNYPSTDYAMDSKFKLELIKNFLASKEMYLARYYFEKEKWIPAINRFKYVIENYDDTVFIEEALHRLVEIHYKIGLEEEAKNYAYLLGYNYQSSEWYKKTYKMFNKNYVSKKSLFNKDKKNNTLIQKIKSKLF